MARYVVISFDDNDEADSFVKHNMLGHGSTIEAVFAKPTVFCDSNKSCFVKLGARKSHSFTRGKKYGWWVCSTCKKPNHRNSSPEKLMRYIIQQGINLLKAPNEQDVITVFDEQFPLELRQD
jgi:hypothetical protein